MIAGIATETIVESTRIMKNPSTSAHSAGHGLTGPSRSLRFGWAGAGGEVEPAPGTGSM